MRRDPFAVLELTPLASRADVEGAYRKLAKQFHPDVNQAPEAVARMSDINWARGELADAAGIAQWRFQLSAGRATPRRSTNGSGPGTRAEPTGTVRRGAPTTGSGRGIVVTVEPRALVMNARDGSSASFTVRAYGISGEDITTRFQSRRLQVSRRATEFGHASFTVRSMGPLEDDLGPVIETLDVLIRGRRVHKLPVTIEPLPGSAGRGHRATPAKETGPLKLTITPASLNLPGKAGCMGSFDVAAVGIGGDSVFCTPSTPWLTVTRTGFDEARARFAVEVRRDLPVDQRVPQVERLMVTAEGRAPTAIQVSLAPLPGARRAQMSLPLTLSFGKYHGAAFDQIAERDPGYLRWMLRADAGSSDERAAARHALDRAGP